VRLPLVGILLCVFALSLQAHDLPRSESTITVHGRDVQVRLRLNLLELRDARWNAGEVVSYPELESRIEALYASIKTNFRLDGGAPPFRTELDRYELEDAHVLRLDLSFHFAQDISTLAVTSTLDQMMQPGHVHFTSVTFGGPVQQAALDANAPRRQFVASRDAYWTTAWSFLRLGIRHLFPGYDHLALLIGILIAVSSLVSLVKVITSFTAGHNIALVMAASGLVVLPARMTESLTALCIAFLAFDNLVGAGLANRWSVSFLFGLAHSFGFANVLREMQLPRGSLALSLFSFNTGVEIGQLLFVGVTFWALRYAAGTWRPLRPAVSVAIGSLALYWFIQRALS
jgi:HupE / UreJ protein